MKNILLCLSILIAGKLYAGAVGGGGVSGKPMATDLMEIMNVYQGANNISRESLGIDNLFKLDLKNRTVTFDAEREVLDESAVMTFDEVKKYALPLPVDAAEILQPVDAAATEEGN